MNKEQLEKMFDEKFGDLWISEFTDKGLEQLPADDEVKQFIFETIIPEVLKSIVGNECIKYNLDISGNIIKQKAKELYGITL